MTARTAAQISTEDAALLSRIQALNALVLVLEHLKDAGSGLGILRAHQTTFTSADLLALMGKTDEALDEVSAKLQTAQARREALVREKDAALTRDLHSGPFRP